MTSKKKKARREYIRQLTEEIFSRRAASTTQPRSSSPLQTMSFRRDSPPQRGRPVSPPRGPRSDHTGIHFSSATWKPAREYGERHRERSLSRSRSPSRDRRRPSERDDSYDYREDVRVRGTECYRPRYDDTPTRPSLKDYRRPSSGGSGHSSPLSKSELARPSKTSIPPGLGKQQQERPKASVEAPASGTGSTKPAESSQDRAMNAPVSLPAAPASVAKMPPLSEETLAEAMQALGGIFEQLINEATTISALKSQHYAAKKRADKRTSEYEKSKSHHDGFPSIKESQTASKVKAEKDLKTITEKVNEKQSLLTGLAVKAAEKLIPALVAQGGGTTERENLQQERISSLEEKIEKLANDQRTLLEEQHKANQTLEEKRQALAKTMDEKHQALQNAVQAVQEQSSSTRHRLETDMAKVEEVVQDAKDSNQAIESLKVDLLQAKGDATRVSTDNCQLSSSLKAQGQQIEALNARIKEIDAIKTELKGIATAPKAARDTVVQIDSLNDKFSKMKDQNSGLVSHITELAKAQKQFRETSALLQRRVEDIEKRPNPATFDTRLQKLEDPRDVRDPGIKKDLDALEDRVGRLERTPPAQYPLPTKFSSEALDARVDALEKAGNRRTALEGNVDQRLTGVEVDIANLRSADLDDVKKRITEVETQQRRASAVTASNSQATPGAAVNLQPQLDTIQEQIDELKEWQQVHDTTWTGVLNEQIDEESKKLQTRISSLEARSSQLSSTLEKRPQVVFDEIQNLSIIQRAAETVVAKFKSKPDLLPFNVDKTLHIVNQALVPMHNSIEATNLSLGNLQYRVDNINTSDLSKHALGQLYELHPDLQKIEALMVGFKADLAGYKTDMQAKTIQIEELREQVNALQGTIRNLETMQDQKTAEAMTRQYHELRKEVDSLTDGGNNMLKKVTTVATELEKVVKEVSDFRNKYNDDLQVSADKFGQLQNDIDEKMDKSKEAPRPSPAVSHRNNGNGWGPRPSSSSIGNRQPSVSSVNSHKKRKLDNSTSAKTNGVRPGSSASRSPQAQKRQRKYFGEDDPDADPDYNEEIPEPGVSDDEDIKPPRKETKGHPKGKPMETAQTSAKIIVLTDSE